MNIIIINLKQNDILYYQGYVQLAKIIATKTMFSLNFWRIMKWNGDVAIVQAKDYASNIYIYRY